MRTAGPRLSARAKLGSILADVTPEETHEYPIIDLAGESEGKCVHIYWELADRETENGRMTAPIYVAVDAGNVGKEVAIRLPKEMAIRLLMILSANWANEVGRVL